MLGFFKKNCRQLIAKKQPLELVLDNKFIGMGSQLNFSDVFPPAAVLFFLALRLTTKLDADQQIPFINH